MTDSAGTARKNSAPDAMSNGAQPVANGMTTSAAAPERTPSAARIGTGARRPRGSDVLLEDELDGVGQRLEQTERAGLLGPEPQLDARRHLALPHTPNSARDGDQPGRRPSPIACRRRNARHRSTSPNTGSSEPRTTTRSDSVWPTASWGSSARLQKAGRADLHAVRPGRTVGHQIHAERPARALDVVVGVTGSRRDEAWQTLGLNGAAGHLRERLLDDAWPTRSTRAA